MAGAAAGSVARAFAQAERREQPFRHWLLQDVLPPGVCEEVTGLPIAPPRIADTRGKRETNNHSRFHFGASARASHACCAALAEALQRGPAVEAIERTCGLDLTGTSLRIEYCQDTDGFWLEPHTDIGVKKLTFLIYLQGAADLGTDLMTPSGDVLGAAPFAPNRGLVFVPGGDTWHGFRRRPIKGVRRSLIVNYVGSDWRARDELAFPDRPVGAPA
jgi:hypothetical protein